MAVDELAQISKFRPQDHPEQPQTRGIQNRHALLPVAAWLPTAIAWALSVRHGILFGLAMGFILIDVDGTLFQRTLLAFSVAAVGSTAAFVPWLCLLVVPWVMHLSICLINATVERDC
jgi:hypothetical protein